MDSITKIDFQEDAIARTIIDAAFHVHKELGPGLLESIYELCLAEELQTRDLVFKKQHPVPVFYKGRNLDTNVRLDLIVADRVIVEIKSVESILPVHKAQLLSYLRLADKRLGLLINFNESLIKHGIHRIVRRK